MGKISKKSEKKNSVKTFYLQFCTAEAARAAHGQTRANACNLMPQCFQIWQVSAKYCTFLDFLAHCWALYQSCNCELRIYVRRTSSTGYSLLYAQNYCKYYHNYIITYILIFLRLIKIWALYNCAQMIF